MIDYADDLDWTYLGETNPRARKVHRCDECGREILPGERYNRAAGIGDGVMSVTKACAHCVAARRWLGLVCGGWVLQGLYDDVEGHIDSSDDVAGMLARGIRCGWDGWTPLDVMGVVGMEAAT